MSDLFKEIVGQTPVKGRLSFYLEAYHNTGVFPNVLLLSQKGSGKTRIARKVGDILNSSSVARGHGRKDLTEINCGAISDSKYFIESLLIIAKEGNVTFFFDEIHALPLDVADWLLTAIEMGAPSNHVSFGNRSADWDFKRLSVIAATTERQKMFIPLLNRFREIELNQYSDEELAAILQQKARIFVEDDAMQYLVSLGRGNARSVVDIAQEINRYADSRGVKKFTKVDAEELVGILDIFPLGLSRAEVHLLGTLQRYNSLTLTRFCSLSGLTRPAQQDAERYLLKHGLLDINEKSHRVLTDAGRTYLQTVKI